MSDGANNSCSQCLELELQVAALIKQNREIELLKKQVGDLQKKLEEKARARKRQASPFRGRKKNADDKQIPGRKPGHQAETRPDPTPDQIDRTLVALVDTCPSCQTALDDVVTHVQYQTDIPPVQLAVTQFKVQVGFCPCCQKRVQGVHPEQTSQALGAANHSLGPRLITMCLERSPSRPNDGTQTKNSAAQELAHSREVGQFTRHCTRTVCDRLHTCLRGHHLDQPIVEAAHFNNCDEGLIVAKPPTRTVTI